MAQQQIRKQPSPQKAKETAPSVESQKDPEIEEHKAHSDELLDEIDGILEENAEVFVAQYVQQGGQ